MKNIFLQLLIFFLLCINAFAANYPLDIINIDEVGANNRIKYAYPNIEYKVVIAAHGGTYPFTWELTTAPSGMTINSSTGEIIWPAPLVSGSPHTIAVKVTDSEASTDTETYTITVTDSTDRFIWMDITNSDTGRDGSFSNPYQNFSDWYASGSGSHGEKILIMRAGIYDYSGITPIDWRGHGTFTIDFDTTYHPSAYIGYPGELVVIDGEIGFDTAGYGANSGKCMRWVGGSALNLYFNNIKFTESFGFFIVISVDADYATFYNNTFDSLLTSTYYQNDSCIFFANIDSAYSEKTCILNNTFQDGIGVTSLGSAVEIYSCRYQIFDNNTVSGLHGDGLVWKHNCWYNTARNNEILNNLGAGVSLTSYADSGDLEIAFNYVSGNGIYAVYPHGQVAPQVLGVLHFNRNTFVGEFAFRTILSTDGPFYTSDNVIINTTPADHIRDETTEHYTILSDRNILSGNLTGVAADGIIDSNGLLLGSYRDTYLGIAGWETTTPTSPGLTCQANDTTANDSYPFTATYTLEGTRTVTSCTWSNSLGGSGSCTATGGNITGTATGLSVGDNVITIELTDSEAETGTCNFTATRTQTAVVMTVSGCDLSGAEM